LMKDFVSVLADQLDDDAILTHLAEMEAADVFTGSSPTTRAFAKELAAGRNRTPETRAHFRSILQERASENIEVLLQRALDNGIDAAPTWFNFAINRLFDRIGSTLRVAPLHRFLRSQFRQANARHTFVSFNYDLAIDQCVQQESNLEWNVQ